ncbi:MAG: DsbA family oxidoreductase [Chitinophagales bacterium]|nr:DsbA family oxidoreductase [Chitinophagales bacterium]
MEKMKVDIWSDVRCPFCYIGKRSLENALKKFLHRDKVELVWHSYELDPNLKTDTSIDIYDYFVSAKGTSREQAKMMMKNMKFSAEGVNLKFNVDEMIVANSFKAHRLIQFAKTKGWGNEIEEALFKAHFIEAKNIDDDPTLLNLAKNIGLDENETLQVLTSDAYTDEVKQDVMTAAQMGVRGVPFFVLNNKYAISGAQHENTFSDALNKAWGEFSQQQKKIEILNEGDSCDVDGNCN